MIEENPDEKLPLLRQYEQPDIFATSTPTILRIGPGFNYRITFAVAALYNTGGDSPERNAGKPWHQS
jgi:hypothetical protein